MASSKKNKKISKTPFSPFSNNILYYITLCVTAAIWGLGQYPSFFFIRFFGFVPFLYIIMNRKSRIREALLFGWIAYILNFYWLFITFRESGKLPFFLSIGIPALLCLYYALQYPLIAIIFKRFYAFRKYLYWSFPLIFVTIDSLYPKLFHHTISDSQIGFLRLVQVIDITGMTGLTIIIMLFNIGLYNIISKAVSGIRPKAIEFVFVLPLILGIVYGHLRIERLDKEFVSAEKIYAAMIQGNISGKEKMDLDNFSMNVERYNELTKKAADELMPELIIWPESVFTRAYDGTRESLQRLIHENYPPLVLGITFWKSGKATNSAIFVEERKEEQRYDKKHLLVFGEYIPFAKTFPFLRYLTPLSYSLDKGDTPSVFMIGKKARASISICFEDIFADEIRIKVKENCNLMINVTNDSWYGKGLGPLHHSILARLRAIENRRSFYRCTATGLTTATDPAGKVIAQGRMWEPEIVHASLPLYEKRSVYSYIGELFTYISIIAVIITGLMILRCYFSDFEASRRALPRKRPRSAAAKNTGKVRKK